MKKVYVGLIILALILIAFYLIKEDSNKVSSSNEFYDDNEVRVEHECDEINRENICYEEIEELHDFKIAIAELMYDKEYKTVEKFFEYHPEGVEAALEDEFGVKDIQEVKDYLKQLSQTVTGKCEICGKAVYADEFTILPEGIKCAHQKCVSKDNNEGPYYIKKDK